MLSIHRYRMLLRPKAPMATPELPVLRGAWGAALREATCTTKASTCRDCTVASSCAYRALFDPLPPEGHALGVLSSVPPPYILSQLVPVPGQAAAALDLVLLAPAQARLPLVLQTIDRALARGLGPARVPWSRSPLLHWQGEWRPVPDASAALPPSQSLDATAWASPEGSASFAITIDLQSPVRLQEDGRIVGARHLTPRRWLVALMRRVSLLADLYGTPLRLDHAALAAQAEAVQVIDAELYWKEGERWSARQHSTHPMGGVAGRWTLAGPLQTFLPLLEFGQWVHVGKQAAFGLGRFGWRVTTSSSPPQAC